MRKTIIIVCLLLSGLIVLDSFNAGHALALFVLAGVIPGTNETVSADSMLALFAMLLGFVLARVSVHFVSTAALFFQSEKLQATSRKA